MSILDEIFAHKRAEVIAAKQRAPESELERQAEATPVPPDFLRALTAPHPSPSQRPLEDEDDLRSGCSPHHPRLIAEVKHRSPSKGVLCQDFDPLRLARTYAENGAAAISVLTDEHYFGGRLSYLREIASTLTPGPSPSGRGELREIPLLRKDFIFDRYQLLEARAAGASAVLLIAAMLDQDVLCQLIAETRSLSLTPLVEIHTRAELDRALDAGAEVVGINNRDLHTFKVRLQTTLDLRPYIPAGVIVVAESGIKTREDVRVLAEARVDAMLIGEGLVTAGDVGERVRLFSGMEEGIPYSVMCKDRN